MEEDTIYSKRGRGAILEEKVGEDMGKELNEMTLDELWQLFPISLVEQKEEWQQWYKEIKQELKEQIPDKAIYSVNHIGSTAINGIQAKNIVDVLVELTPETDLSMIAKQLSAHEYMIMSTEGNRVSLNKGYTKNGFAKKVYHIHLRLAGDKDEVLFRDFLNAHPEIAAEYEALKIELSKKFKHDRDAYTDAKGDFVKKWTAIARKKGSKKP